MRKPLSFIFPVFLLLLFFHLHPTSGATVALREEGGEEEESPPPPLHPKHDKSGRTGRPLYKQVAPFPAVGEGDLNGIPTGSGSGEPVQDNNELFSDDRGQQPPPPLMPPLPSSNGDDSSSVDMITLTRTNLSAGYRCDGVQRFCADGLTCELSYHLGGGSGGGDGSSSSSSTTSHQHHHQQSKRSASGSNSYPHHLVEGVCSQRTCESKCDLDLASAASSMKCPPDSFLVQYVMLEGGGGSGGEGDDGSKPCCIQTCKCIPDICSSARRNCSFLYDRTRLGTEEPGNCCDTIQCPEDIEPEMERSKHPQQQQVAKSPAVSAPKTSCRIEGEQERQHGERWLTGHPDCETCHCQSGVKVCSRQLNCPLPFNCTDSQAEIDALPADQCCPKCKRCFNPLRPYNDVELPYNYGHGESWFSRDHCTECRCTDGQASCYSETCQAPAVACARDQSWAPLEGATAASGGGGGLSCCHSCTCQLDCGRGVPYLRSATTGLEVCDCNLTAAATTVSDLQLFSGSGEGGSGGGGDDGHSFHHQLLQSTASPGELVSFGEGGGGGDAAAAVNTSPSSSSVDLCLDGGGEASCTKQSESVFVLDTASWIKISCGLIAVVLIFCLFFYARIKICPPGGRRRRNRNRNGTATNRNSFDSVAYTPQPSAPVNDI